MLSKIQIFLAVALRKESVDRNIDRTAKTVVHNVSLSARRAWIEIAGFIGGLKAIIVALRKESVDRNMLSWLFRLVVGSSLSARRAWIEIKKLLTSMYMYGSRSPQGERG